MKVRVPEQCDVAPCTRMRTERQVTRKNVLVRAHYNAQTAVVRHVTADEVVGDPCARLGVYGGTTDIQIIIKIKLLNGHPSERCQDLKKRCIVPRASSDHTLNVSISVAAHTPFRVPLPAPIQPACEMLLPRLPTCKTASSSSDSFAFDIHTSPSVDPDSK